MSDLNCYSFTGRLGKDAELKFTQGGTPIWTASVGVGYGYGDNKGTNWILVKVFGKRAESLGKLELQKGAAVGIAGELQVREYDKNDGTRGYSVEVVTQDVALLSKPQGSPPAGQRRDPAPAQEKPTKGFDDVPFDDDIPFD